MKVCQLSVRKKEVRRVTSRGCEGQTKLVDSDTFCPSRIGKVNLLNQRLGTPDYRSCPLVFPLLSLNRLDSARDGTHDAGTASMKESGEMDLDKQDVCPQGARWVVLEA